VPKARLPSPSLDMIAASTGAYVSDLLTPTLRLGVTGLARAGKTVFITALVRNLVSGGRLPFLRSDAEGRIASACLEPQPDDSVPRFDYEAHLASLERDPPEWPDSTRRISELRVTITFKAANRWRRALGIRRLHIDIVDYPGEWLIDLAMLDQDYTAWSAEALALAREPSRAEAATPFLAFLAGLSNAATTDEQTALEGAKLFTAYLKAAREKESVSTLGPGRFLLPGDLEGSPLLTFFPLERASSRKSLNAMLERRFESYKSHAVRPFFKDHFARLDRQIVLVDVLSQLNGGPTAVADLERALAGVLKAFRPGTISWLSMITGKRIDKLLFAATKADHLHHQSHDRLEAILRLITQRASVRAEGAGAEVGVMALAALRATSETEARDGDALLGCLKGVPMPGERVGNRVFDGREEAVLFPGELPSDPAKALGGAEDNPSTLALPEAAFIRFRPPRLDPANAAGTIKPAPHIRLDRALDFLIGDWLV
jgi:uncharacterized protein